LAEVRRLQVLELLPAHLRPSWYSIVDRSGQDGERNDFDLAILYDSRRLQPRETPAWVRAPHADSMVRAALVATFATSEGGPLVVALAHWRSDARDGDDAAARRAKSAETLRECLASRAVELGADPSILVLGGHAPLQPIPALSW
jgi:hypothetical protein